MLKAARETHDLTYKGKKKILTSEFLIRNCGVRMKGTKFLMAERKEMLTQNPVSMENIL